MFSRALSTSRARFPTAATAVASSSAVNSIILRSLKEHYLEVSKMTPPPKISPPRPYTIVKGALDQSTGPVLRRVYGEAGEEISISVARLANIMPPGADSDSHSDGGGGASESISQLFLHVDISRPESSKSMQFLCGLYPDAVGIHSVCLRSKTAPSGAASVAMAAKGGGEYQGRIFQELDEKVRDAFHLYIEARGINEKLFPFLQAWLYVKDHRNLVRWFKSVGTVISEPKLEPKSESIMPEDKFHKLADDTIHDLLEKLEEYGDSQQMDGFDIDYGNQVLTLRLGDLGTYVVNKQTPNRQIWLSSPVSGPARFDWDAATHSWVYRRTGVNLMRLLENEIGELCGTPVDLS